MSFEQDVQLRANEKVAGLMDTLGDLIGNNGSLSTPLTALGGAALGGMAGKGLGMGGLGIGLGAALGGALGGVGANAINSQNMYQNMNDAAMINGISAGLNANDQTDMMQNQAIAQTNDTVNQLVGIVGDMMQGGMAAGGMMSPADPSMMGGQMPPMDPSMGAGMDPSMMGGQMPPMDQGAMMPPPPPSAPMTGQVDNNGLGMKQGSYNGFAQDVFNRTNQKLASLIKVAAEDDGGEMQGVTKAWTQDIPETTWFENLANSAPVSALLDAAEATGVDRWADSMNEFAGNIGDWVGELERGSEGDIAQAVAQTRYNDVFNSMQNKAIDTFNRYKKENPFADVSFVPQADQGVLSVLMDKSPDTIARNIGKIPSEAVRKFDPRYMETSLDAIVPIAARSSIPDYFGGLKADKTGYSFFKPWKGEFQIGVYPKDMPRVGPVNLDNLYNLSIK